MAARQTKRTFEFQPTPASERARARVSISDGMLYPATNTSKTTQPQTRSEMLLFFSKLRIQTPRHSAARLRIPTRRIRRSGFYHAPRPSSTSRKLHFSWRSLAAVWCGAGASTSIEDCHIGLIKIPRPVKRRNVVPRDRRGPWSRLGREFRSRNEIAWRHPDGLLGDRREDARHPSENREPTKTLFRNDGRSLSRSEFEK